MAKTQHSKRAAEMGARLRDWGRWSRVYVLDTEFQAPPGELQRPVCVVARELVSGELIEAFLDRSKKNPFLYDDATLFVGYNLASEWKTFLQLGWELPKHGIDLYFEFLRVTNKKVKKDRQTPVARGHSLLDACDLYGIDSMSQLSKSQERQHIIENGVMAPEGVPQYDYIRRVLDYCAEDVRLTVELLFAMMPWLPMRQALVRGAYAVPVAYCESHGLPLDVRFLRKVVKYRDLLRAHLAKTVEQKNGYDVHNFAGDGDTLTASFDNARFAALVQRLGLASSWPKTKTGKLSLDMDSLKEMAEVHPALSDLKELKKSEAGLRNFKFPISSDARNRSSIFPFNQAASRNNHSSGFLLGGPKWLRHAIQPPPGFALVVSDIVSEEFILGAAFSGDADAAESYSRRVDQYLDLAVRSGYAPAGATKATHAAVRKRFKVLQLAGQYGAGHKTVAQRLGCFFYEAEVLLAAMRKVQARYWQWAEGQIIRAKKHKKIETLLGWQMAVTPEIRTANGHRLGTKHNSILNFPIQSHGAEILRVAMILLVEAGLGPYLASPQHDSIYLVVPEDMADHAAKKVEDAFVLAGWLITRRVEGAIPARLLVDCHVYRYPERYEDPDGKAMYDLVRQFTDTKPDVNDKEWAPLYADIVGQIERGRKKKSRDKGTLNE